MRTEIVPRPASMETGIKLIPETDADILTIGTIISRSNPDKVSLKLEYNRLEYGYTTIPELIRVASLK